MAISTKKIEGDESVHHVSLRKKRGRGKPKMQPPLTPMIDVTFQLLLFFLLTTEFRPTEGQIPSALPAEGQQAVQADVKPETIRIDIEPRGEEVFYRIRGMGNPFADPNQLFDALLGQKVDGPPEDQAPVYIKPASDVKWKYVVEAFNQASRAGFKEVGFASSSG